MRGKEHKEYLDSLTKEELVALVLGGAQRECAGAGPGAARAAAGTRKVLLKVAYLGADYHGLELQANGTTVEHHLFRALGRAGLVDSIEAAGYHKCGRTDAGVSAAAQFLSLSVRSRLCSAALAADHALTEHGGVAEYPYDAMLNRHLPSDVWVQGWLPVRPEFSARFDCRGREYVYLFLRKGMDVEKMAEAAQMLEGRRCFKLLCKRSVEKAFRKRARLGEEPGAFDDRYYAKTVTSASVEFVKDLGADALCRFVIRSPSFLHNQVRKTFSLLALVGEGKVAPHDVPGYLDGGARHAGLAPAAPDGLVLASCFFDGIDVGSLVSSSAKFGERRKRAAWEREVLRAHVLEEVLGLRRGA